MAMDCSSSPPVLHALSLDNPQAVRSEGAVLTSFVGGWEYERPLETLDFRSYPYQPFLELKLRPRSAVQHMVQFSRSFGLIHGLVEIKCLPKPLRLNNHFQVLHNKSQT